MEFGIKKGKCFDWDCKYLFYFVDMQWDYDVVESKKWEVRIFIWFDMKIEIKKCKNTNIVFMKFGIKNMKQRQIRMVDNDCHFVEIGFNFRQFEGWKNIFSYFVILKVHFGCYKM